MPEHLETRGVGPLQVVEHEHDDLVARRVAQQRAHRFEQDEAIAVGITRSAVGRRGRNAACQRGDEPRQRGAVLLDVVVEQLLRARARRGG